MPPPPSRPRPVVKSGNAGNSSKPKPNNEQPSTSAPPKSLFPPNAKTPLSLLHERCRKNSWEKPVIETRKHGNGWSFVVVLIRLVHKRGFDGDRETVRLEPHPPYVRPTVQEAQHWGATYALYRFCNGIQLNRILPPGPREYWNELATEHKNVEEHQKWMYESDPFAARKAVTERQEKALKRKDESQQGQNAGGGSISKVSKEFLNAPEVKMATELRELVEDAIKKTIALYPEAEDAAPFVLTETHSQELPGQLGQLGFKIAHARNAVAFLSQPSPLASKLLHSANPLEACIEYLILHVPECDLPQRFLPAVNSSNPFITATHGVSDDLKRRWIEERATKQAGFPAHVVRECLEDARLIEDWALLVTALNHYVAGKDWLTVFEEHLDITEAEPISTEEAEAIGASYDDDSTLTMPLFVAPIQVHFVIPPTYIYNKSSHPPPIYLTSNSVPAYVRLHLLSKLHEAFESGFIRNTGEGVCLGVMQVLEEQWGHVEDQGPPDISIVLQHLMPKSSMLLPLDDGSPPETEAVEGKRRAGKRGGQRRKEHRTDHQILQEFELMRKQKAYRDLYALRKKLPAFTAKEEFLGLLQNSRVVIVVGETGSGKTTQLPQFILDALILGGQGSTANILVTQPRRISAISVAARVSTERVDDGSVGYTIRGESKQSEKTKLLFCTTGVVLRRLGSGDGLKDVTHVIVDEVHERSVDGDFLLLELKELLNHNPTIKIILMSATINHETFVQYFNGAPLLSIPGFAHPVTDKYLEDVLPLIKYRPSSSKRGQKQDEDEERMERNQYRLDGLDEQTAAAVQAISRSDNIDYQLISAVVDHIVSSAQKKGGILIFLPGVQEIRQCIERLKTTLSNANVVILPLHANLSSNEQRTVFVSTSKWKIVVATNVAETSITIDDIIYVVDAGKVKETRYDTDSGLTKLVETWVTRAAARQRRGRAGRTQPGICYKLYTRAQEQKMARYPRPEILRVPLESISLTVKATREKQDVKAFLRRAIDPPDVAALDNAWQILKELGAIDQEGELTALGRHMATIPLDLRLGKMLILGTIFQCLGPILTIAACLSSKPVFISPIDKRDEANQARARFALEKSDILTDVHAYDECMRLRSEGQPSSAIKTFCEQNFISYSTIRDITALRNELLNSLTSLSLVPAASMPDTPALNVHSGAPSVLKSILLAAFYPRVSRISLPKGAVKFDQVAAGTVPRENTAKEFKAVDMRGERVWIHPASVLFSERSWRSGIVVSFLRVATGRVFLRDVTEVPLYALLLFGGNIAVNHIGGGLVVGGREGMIKLRAWPRIGILVQQLRRLLDARLMRAFDGNTPLSILKDDPVVDAMLALLSGDGLTWSGC